MMIRLQTSKQRDIPNLQVFAISQYEINWAADIPKAFPKTEVRTDVSGIYNCHGLTFASRRTRVPESESVALILRDDRYEEIALVDAKPGDIIIYYADDGDATHSGVIVENEEPLHVLRVLSKWGSGPEVLHRFFDVPTVYGGNHRVFRCRL